MNMLLDTLIDTLQKQLAIYKELLSLSIEKQPVLVKGDIKQLARITKEEEILILRVGKLEKQRLTLNRELANHFGLSPEELNANELVNRIDGKNRGALQTIINEMTGVIAKLGNKNKANSDLIKNSLDYVNLSLNLLTGDNAKPSYNDSTEEKQNISSKIFDRTI